MVQIKGWKIDQQQYLYGCNMRKKMFPGLAAVFLFAEASQSKRVSSTKTMQKH